jgi:hypothetical protein
MRKLMISFISLILSFGILAKVKDIKNIFIGFEILDKLRNNCEYFAGDIGYKF